MKILCRADASHFLGTGHIMRQLTLARALKAKGAQVDFMCRTHSGHLGDFIMHNGFECHLYPVLRDCILGACWAIDATDTANLATRCNADWVFVDHYGVDAAWEKKQSTRVFAMDDMFNRHHACQILLNQNLGATADQYVGLIANDTQCLMGEKYALLRPEFLQLRPTALARRFDNTLRHILVTMGGYDQPNATEWVLGRLLRQALPADIRITVVMGRTAPHLAAIQDLAANLPWPIEILVGTNNMAGLMADADVAIGAAGSTSWERCAMGLPAVQVVLAENQCQIGKVMQNMGAAFSVDLWNGDGFDQAAHTLLTNQGVRQNMSQAAGQIIDGAGVNRVIETLYNFQIEA